jgi:carboxy-cis,cis-muconate cyclase
MLHHLMVGTWTPPGAIFTFEFDDASLTLKLVQKTSINHDEPISWMTFDVSITYGEAHEMSRLNPKFA